MLAGAASTALAMQPVAQTLGELSAFLGRPDAAAARFRLHQAVLAWLRHATATGPVAVLLDDLHQADTETLALLETVATGLAGSPLLLMAAYRPAEAGVSALTEHRAALLEHLHDEEEYILPLIEEHLTVAEWARLGQRFAEEVPKDKLLFFLGMILEDADPAERQAMMANLPAPARFVWRAFGQRQFRRRVSKIRAGLERS